ncbi:MAG TPA: carboxypeptidase-like regulatory domain-containing protein [Pirellulales bacterium]|nr:carboxypeptidase-like regulatory domain-containing protein [Pirellulales bacterium]
MPPPLVKPLRAFRAPLELDANQPEQSLPPILVRPGRSVRGRVVNAEGEPVAGALVQASWPAHEPWLESYAHGTKWITTRSDERGDFAFTGIDPVDNPNALDRGVRFWAAGGDMATEAFVAPPPDADAAVELKLSPSGMVSLSGRVVDGAGHAVSGAKVQTWTRWRHANGFVLVQTPLFVSTLGDIAADSDGRFQTPPVLSCKGEYSLLVSCDGFIPARGAWFQPAGPENKVADAPDICLRRLRTVAGRVVDRRGHPLAGVRLYQSGDGVRRTTSITGADGRFTLPDVAENSAFVFAELDGYRFTGQPIAESADTKLVLTHDDETVAPLTLLRANVLDREQELALGRQVIGADVERTLRSGNRDERWTALYYWTVIDPADALERIDNGAIPNLTVDDKDFLLTQIARLLVHDHPDEAAAVAHAIEGAGRRTRALFELAGALPTADPAAKRALLDEALLASTHDNLRSFWQACVADGLLDLGQTDRARALLADASVMAATLPIAGDGAMIRRKTADILARTDLPAALSLVTDVAEEKERDLIFGKIAYRVAAQQPAEAERVLAMIGDEYRLGFSTVRVCYRMATVDGERARKLAGRLTSPYLRALSLGWTARGFAISDRRRACSMLNEAFGILHSLVEADEGRFYGPQSAAVAAAALLPVVEAIDPQLVREYLWRAVSFRRSYPHDDQQDRLAEAATLALLLAQYDRDVARLVLEPVVDRLKRRSRDQTSVCVRAAVDAACAIDPKWAARVFEQEDIDDHRYYFSWRYEFAHALAIQPSIRTRILLGKYLWYAYWLPGGPDNELQIEF